MSQLTQNTTDLDALIAKANALPDAGGGGSVETCTVTCNALYMDEPGIETIIVYMSTDGVITTDAWYVGTLSVVKNSVLCVMDGAIRPQVSGNIEIMSYLRGCTAMSVTGDAVIDY